MTILARATCALACLICAGCGGPGHTRWSEEFGFHLFSVPVISIHSARYEHMSEACAIAGDRLSSEPNASPLSILGLGRDTHLLRAGPSDAQAEAPTPDGSAPPRDPPRSESRDADAPNGPGDGAGAAHRPDPRARR